MGTSTSTLHLAPARGAIRCWLEGRVVAGGDLVELCTSGGWITGRFEWDPGMGGAPRFHFSVEREGGDVLTHTIELDEAMRLRWPRVPAVGEAADPRCGELYWVEPFDDRSTAPHPHLVVSPDVFNRSRLDTVIVCALTSSPKRGGEPGNVWLEAGEGGLERASAVVVSQISSIPKAALGARIGALSEARVEEVLRGLAFLETSYYAR